MSASSRENRLPVTEEPLRLTLHDLTSAPGRVDADAMRDLARQLGEVGRRHPMRSRAAFVCSREPDYLIVRSFTTAALIEGHPVRFAIFAERESAQAWLESGGVAP